MFRLNVLLTFVVLAVAFKPVEKVFQTLKGTIQFKSEAPMELIKASSKELAGAIDSEKKQFSFRVKIRTFQGFNGNTQKEHFNENYLESDKYPEASFKGKIIEDVDFTKDGNYELRAKGKLLIHGVSQERIIKCDVVVKGNLLTIQSKFTVLLSDHNIPIPKVVYQKLANEIQVDVNATLESI